MRLQVPSEHLPVIEEILRRHVPDREVWAFGSRVKGTAKDTSDLDLVVRGESPLPFAVLGGLRDDFSESNLPYRVDLVDWANTSDSFRRIIEHDSQIVQRANGTTVSVGAPRAE